MEKSLESQFTFSMISGEAWTDTRVCGHFGKGDEFTPFTAAGADGKDRYVIHVPGKIHESERLEGGCIIM